MNAYIPELSYPQLRWFDWIYEAPTFKKSVKADGSIAIYSSVQPMTILPPNLKIEDFSDTFGLLGANGPDYWQNQAHDYVSGWCISAALDGLRAIVVDRLADNAKVPLPVIALWFNVNKFDESSKFPWFSSYALTPSWDFFSMNFGEKGNDLDEQKKPPVAPPQDYSGAALGSQTYFVNQPGHRPQDRLNAFSDAVTGASWKKFLDYLAANGMNAQDCFKKFQAYKESDASVL